MNRRLWRFDHYRTRAQRAAFRAAQSNDELAERADVPPLAILRKAASQRRLRAMREAER